MQIAWGFLLPPNNHKYDYRNESRQAPERGHKDHE